MILIPLLFGCPSTPGPRGVKPEDLYGFWTSEGESPRVLQFEERDDYWAPQIEGEDVYIGYDVAARTADSISQGGQFRAESGVLTLDPTYEVFGATASAVLDIESFDGDAMTLTASTGPRDYTWSAHCPLTFTRNPSERDGLIRPTFGTDGPFYLNGGTSLAFDQDGQLHMLLGLASATGNAPRYATTRGGCGMRVWDAPNAAASAMTVDEDNQLHAALLTWEAELLYGTKPADADGDAWVFEIVAQVPRITYRVGLELRPDGSPVVIGPEAVHERSGGGWSARPWFTAFDYDTAILPDGRILILESGGLLAISVEDGDGFQRTTFEGQPGNAVTDLGIDVDPQGRVHVVTARSAGPGFQYGHMLEHGIGSPTELTFRTLGIGTDPSIAIDPSGTAHIWATQHRGSITGLYYQVDGENVRAFEVGQHITEPYSRPALAVSNDGTVAMGEQEWITLWLEDAAAPTVEPVTHVFQVANGAAIRVQGQECTTDCEIVARPDAYLRVELANPGTYVQSCFGDDAVCLLFPGQVIDGEIVHVVGIEDPA